MSTPSTEILAPVQVGSGQLRQVRVLVSLYDQELKALWGMRAARALSVSILLSTGLLMWFVNTLAGDLDVDLVALRGLVALSWLVGGAAALSATRNMKRVPSTIEGLAGLLGLQNGLTELALTLAVARRTVSLLAPPALLLAVAALLMSANLSTGLARLALVTSVLVYCALLSLVIAVLANLCQRLSSRHQQSWLLGLVVLPEVLRLWRPSTPTLPRVFAWLLDRMADVGGLW